MTRKRVVNPATTASFSIYDPIYTPTSSEVDGSEKPPPYSQTLPLRPKEHPLDKRDGEQLGLEIHPLPSGDGLIVKIQPPVEPLDHRLEHVPCDIVLVIDVSGSMDSDAPVPTSPDDVREQYGLTVLDLTKHAALTIVETLNKDDRLGIVTFSGEAKVIQSLTSMTPANKKAIKKKIQKLETEDVTNLWGGISVGLDLFGSANATGNVPALMVLTDGMPNHKCPSQGYVPKLRGMGQLPATIHTFGFGYSLRSGLLKSIAEVGGGNYSFIPDAGMIGTIFIHAVANLQSTCATNAVLRLTYPSYLGLEETTGEAVDKQRPVKMEGVGLGAPTQLTISLSNLQYGHPRDIYLRAGPGAKDGATEESPPAINAVLEYQRLTADTPAPVPTTSSFLTLSSPLVAVLGYQQHIHPVAPSETVATTVNFFRPSSALSPAEIAYHTSRSALVAFLSSLYPLRADDEHEHPSTLPDIVATKFEALLASFPASSPEFESDPLCQSLVKDLCGPMRTGQVALALSEPMYYNRWGKHYLPSLAGAHARQVCNSFKDPGPLMYGRESPLFIRCRNRLDAAFDDLPAPKPTRPTAYRGSFSMSSYNRSSNPCFAGCSMVAVAVKTAEGNLTSGLRSGWGQERAALRIRIGKLRAGMRVLTPKGPRTVALVLKTRVRRERMVLVGEGVLVTPWHPVRHPQSGAWVFPKDVARREVRYTGSIYSVLLQRDADADTHAINVGGLWGVTLGHGKTGERTPVDVRAHQFLGNWDRVVKALEPLERNSDGLVYGGGVRRNWRTGLVDGFKKASAGQARDTRRM